MPGVSDYFRDYFGDRDEDSEYEEENQHESAYPRQGNGTSIPEEENEHAEGSHFGRLATDPVSSDEHDNASVDFVGSAPKPTLGGMFELVCGVFLASVRAH